MKGHPVEDGLFNNTRKYKFGTIHYPSISRISAYRSLGTPKALLLAYKNHAPCPVPDFTCYCANGLRCSYLYILSLLEEVADSRDLIFHKWREYRAILVI